MPIYNPGTILDAWAQLAAERDDVQLIVKHMSAAGDALGAIPYADRVHVVGNVDYDRMPDYYRVADACVSIASSDSAPRSVFEAMACGTPCVISDLPWVHEQIGDEREALIVPIEAEAVAAALRRLLADAELSTGVAARARDFVKREHDQAVHMDRLADTYRSLLQLRECRTTDA
jgi:glycosyltransferase involved in cell wall biosynthesis